jgi:hypothetical protein
MRPTPYDALLATLRSGPPVWSPVGLPGPLYDRRTCTSFYVHHEDVRRLVDPTPRGPCRGWTRRCGPRLRLVAPVFTRRAKGSD